MSILVEKMHTALNLLDNPSFFKNFRRGIIPGFYSGINKKWLKSYGFRTILDIGANVGRFSVTANALFPDARIIAFEPLPDCFAAAKRLNARFANVEVHNIALGDEEGQVDMFQNDFSPSSSLLPIADAHKEAFPFTARDHKVSVAIRRLDDIAPTLGLFEPMFIKVDVQGFEKQLIDGGRNTFERATVVLLELSFEELYEGQGLFDDIYTRMRALGFTFRGVMGQMQHPSHGRPIDADCFFVKD